MKVLPLFAFAALLISAAAAEPQAQAPFTQTLDPSAFSSAGLEKLTPTERARLDELVTAYQSGELQRAKERAEQAERAQAQAEQRARQETLAREKAAADLRAAEAAQARAQARAQEPASQAKPTAVIAPGTQIEYSAIESRIVGSPKGWGPETMFTLENGQEWQVADRSHYYNGAAVVNPRVTVKPARFFGFEMVIEGLGSMRVKLINGTTYRPSG